MDNALGFIVAVILGVTVGVCVMAADLPLWVAVSVGMFIGGVVMYAWTMEKRKV